jgi:hypothetical protein
MDKRLACCLLVMIGCAPKRQVVINPAFDFSKVRRISIVPLEGLGGPAATDELVKTLVGTGIEVTDAKHPGDLVLKGSVTEYKPNMQLMVFIGNDDTVLTAGAQTTPEVAAAATHRTQVASITAVVGMQLHAEDPSHHIVWADSYSYEGVDLPAALGPVVDALTRSLERVVPQMKVSKSS